MKKYLSLLLIAVMVLSCFAVSFAADDTITDQESGNNSVYYDNVAFLSERGIIDDATYAKCNPKQKITRSEFVKMLAAVANIDLSIYDGRRSFSDVEVDSRYSQVIQWASEAGIVDGTAVDMFSPNAYVSRESMAVIVDRYGNTLDGFEFQQVRDNIQFVDSSDISKWAEEAVTRMFCAELIDVNEKGLFLPRNYASRADAVKAITLLYVYLQEYSLQEYLLTHGDEIDREIEAAQKEMQELAADPETSSYFDNGILSEKEKPSKGFWGGEFQFLDGDILYTNGTYYFGHIGMACGNGILEITNSGIQRISYSTWANRYSDRWTYVLRRIPAYCNGDANCRQVSITAAWYGQQYFLLGAGSSYSWGLTAPLSSTTEINCSGLAYKCYRDGAGFYYKRSYTNNATGQTYYVDPSPFITPAEIFNDRVYNGFSAIYKF